MKRPRTIALWGLVGLLGVSLGIAAWIFGKRGERSILIQSTVRAVPASASFFGFRGKGFATPNGRNPVDAISSDGGSLTGQLPRQTVSVSAPGVANGEFQLGSVPGLLAKLHLVGAAPRVASVEQGTLTYRSVYPGVDVVAIRDPERFELNYILNERRDSFTVALSLAEHGGVIAADPDGSLTVRGESGSPRLRFERPVAVDSEGTVRLAEYSIHHDVVRIALHTADLKFPVVLDPVIYIPYWTLAADARQPGSAGYLPARGSRETQVALNPKSGNPWLIRPVRSQQREDHSLHFGTLNFSTEAPFLSPLARVSGSNGPTFTAAQLLDWQRTYFAQSETWEWTGSRWQLLPQSGLAGLIDASLAYAPGPMKMVAFGGATPEFTCGGLNYQNGDNTFCTTDLASLKDSTRLYENDGAGWSKKGLSGAPPPRLRPGMSSFGAGVLVFGGRAMSTEGNQRVNFSDGQYFPSFPDSLSAALLSDTWLYDGANWKPISTGNPPPAQESAKIVYDSRRKRAVLVGGNSVARPETVNPPVIGMDPFSLWEFDGSDWIQRFEPGDTRLPVSFQKRRGVTAVWHPVRQTTILFGGFVDVLDSCPYSGTTLEQKRFLAATDATLAQQLRAAGCTPGYAHDTWEWDGGNLKQLTQVAFRGFDAQRILQYSGSLSSVQQPVYCQVAGTVPAPGTLANDNLTGAGQTHLWPWRYDASGNHFPLRSALERAYAPPASAAPARKDAGSAQAGAAAPSTPTFVSPLFGANTTPQISFDPTTGRILILPVGGGKIFDTDLQSWVERTPTGSPFDQGQNDFFASTWDTARQRVVLFDPKTGLTWEHADNQPWVNAQAASSPGIWAVDSAIRAWRELDVAGLLQLPKMSYDRSRARTTMLYRNALWEYDGSAATWVQRAVPAALTSCTAATMMTFDATRNRTVVVGCLAPGKTWEWDGSTWTGPFAGPFIDTIRRGDDASNPTPPFDPNFRWQGTLQLPWAHPNALFESASLGGVGLMDAAGTLRTWNGSTWAAGPVLLEGHLSDAARSIFTNFFGYGLPYQLGFINDYDYVPNTFSPPLVEDYNGNRLLVFRDGLSGLRELSFAAAPPQRQWAKPYIGSADPIPTTGDIQVVGPNDFQTRVHPHPFELLSPEHIDMQAITDTTTRTNWSGQPKSSQFTPEEWVNNLYWPFRLLADPVAHRVRVLTHRGVIWEMGNEGVQTRGGPCVTKNDCADGNECEQGVCCYSNCSGSCQTCNGAHPGTCETMAEGNVCKPATCSNGILTTTAQCSAMAQCVYNGPSQACAGDLNCADSATCKAHCTSPADCRDPTMICTPDGNSCVPNQTCRAGALYRPDGNKLSDCPGNLGCANATSCNTRCTARSDCADVIATCSVAGDSCVADHVTQVAATRGVAPTAWKPAVHRTRADIVASLLAAGLTPDEEGRFLFKGMTSVGLHLAFDPNLYDPTTGLRSCVTRINVCADATSHLDSCVAGAPRCVSSTPWKDDPGGEDCCPEACLLEYFDSRTNKSASAALMKMIRGVCYPGMAALLNGGSP